MKLVIIILIAIVLFVGYAVYERSDYRVEQSRQAGLGFAKVCEELNGKPFSFENISPLNGYVDLNGKDRLAQKDIDLYLKEYMSNKDKPFVLYHQSLFHSFGVEQTWNCIIDVNEANLIKSKATFYVGD